MEFQVIYISKVTPNIMRNKLTVSDELVINNISGALFIILILWQRKLSFTVLE